MYNQFLKNKYSKQSFVGINCFSMNTFVNKENLK